MSHDAVYILGLGATTVGRQPERSFTDLAREAMRGAFAESGLADPEVLDQVWFSNYMMDFWGQRACRGQEVLTPLVKAECSPRRCQSSTSRPGARARRSPSTRRGSTCCPGKVRSHSPSARRR